jgi:flagellar biosynthetic protein FliR
MLIEADWSFISAIILLFIRLSASLLLTPLFSIAQVPVHIRTFFLLSLAGILVASLQLTPAIVPYTIGDLFQAGLYELIIGALLAFGLFAAFGAFLLGGRILDFQMGFGVASLVDPATQTQAPLLGTILNLTAVATFFLLDGHHMLIRGIAYSLEKAPLGQGVGQLQIDVVITQFGRMFTHGLMIVAPAVFVILLLDAGLAVAARTMPQVNIFIVGLPLKILVGSIVLAFSLGYFGPLLNKIFESLFRYWEQVLA